MPGLSWCDDFVFVGIDSIIFTYFAKSKNIILSNPEYLYFLTYKVGLPEKCARVCLFKFLNKGGNAVA